MIRKRTMTPADKAAIKRFNDLMNRISEETSVNPFETPQERTDRITRSKVDYNYFVRTYFPHYAVSDCATFHTDTAKLIQQNPTLALLLGWGRGLAKSTHIDILIPLWLWINNDLKVMLLVGQNEAKANILLGDLQAEFESNNLLKHDFGEQKAIGSWEDGKFVTQNGCAFFAIGMGQSPRGIRYRQNRPDYVACDDLDTKELHRNPRRLRQAVAWITEDLMGVSGMGNFRFVMVNNIFAPVTILTELRDNYADGFRFIRQDATDADLNPYWSHYTKEYFVQKVATMGTLSFWAEYNNTPYAEGTIFTDNMIVWGACPPLESYERLIAYWDVAYSAAKTADYNAVKLWGLKNGLFYLIKAFVRQCTMPTAIQFMYALQSQTKRRINFYYEAQFWDDAMRMTIDSVAREFAGPGWLSLIGAWFNRSSQASVSITLIRAARPTTNKYDRIQTLLPYYQQGVIIYNLEERNNPDMLTGLAQLYGIEPGYKTHDDSPDADAAAIELLSKHVHKTNTKFMAAPSANRRW